MIVVYWIVPPHDRISSHASGHIVDGRGADIGEAVVSGKGDDYFAIDFFQVV